MIQSNVSAALRNFWRTMDLWYL